MPGVEYDTIVVGVGVIGAATAAHLSERGEHVLALEKYDIPNPRGTSAGTSRIFRLAYHEGDTYVPLLRDALEQWVALDTDATRPILRQTGSLTIGASGGAAFTGAKQTCEAHGIDHEILDGTEISTRFPGFDLPATYRAVWQPDGHLIDAEQGVVALVQRAHENGCVIYGRTPVTDWQESGDHVAVETPRGTYEASDLVITSGAWAVNHLPDIGRHLTVERHVACRFHPSDPSQYQPDTFPVFVMDTAAGGHFYGLPIHRVPGIKVGGTNTDESGVDPDALDRDPVIAEEQSARAFTEEFLGGAGPTMDLSACALSHSPDDDFIVDTIPDESRVHVGVGMSGHGYKLAPAVGELLAELIIDGETTHDREQFRVDRFVDDG